MAYILLLNGPPRSGKDTLADMIAEQYGFTPLKFATPLREAVPAAFGISQDDWEDLIEEHKGEPCERLDGLTPREAQIWLSEEAIKPRFGEDFFGRVLANRIATLEQERHRGYVISDSGFVGEAAVLKERFGAENIALMRLHREGCTFEGDSRSYIYLTDVFSADINNDGTPDDMFVAASQVLWAHMRDVHTENLVPK